MFLKSNHAITKFTPKKPYVIDGQLVHTGPSVSYKVRSNRLAVALQRRGMCKHKPDRFPCPEIENSPDFWRGVFDADGSLWEAKNQNPDIAFSLCGHRPMLEKFQQFLKNKGLAENLALTPTQSGILRIGTAGSVALKVIYELYRTATTTTALTRKFELAKQLTGLK